jgi:hypothetical protein
VTDINGRLIPAWQLEQGIRPGTVIVISARLHIYNINLPSSSAFRRVRTQHYTLTRTNQHSQFFQINAERIKVLAEPLPDESPAKSEPCPPTTKPQPFDDLALFTTRKRKEDDPPENHASKKKKTRQPAELDHMDDK